MGVRYTKKLASEKGWHYVIGLISLAPFFFSWVFIAICFEKLGIWMQEFVGYYGR